MSFQLQNLPFVALEEVIKCMGPISILCIIKTSTKTKKYVVEITKRLKTNLNLLLNEQRARCTPYQDYDQEMEPSYYLRRYTYEYSMEKFITVIEYFTNVFSINTVSLNLETRCPIDPYLLWKYVKDQNLKIKTLVWKTEDFIDEGVKEVIEGSSDLEKLEMHFKKEAPVLSAVDLYPLITCESVTLRNMNLTSENLNLFLKHWVAKPTKLKAICIVAVENFDRLTAIEGLDLVDMQAEPHPDYENFEIMFWKTKFLVEQKSPNSLSMSFRLRHLPSLAYDEVIKCMDTFDILTLIEVSRKKKKHVVGITKKSSEFLPRFLDECTEVTECIRIPVCFPDNFWYTPPRPFKAREFRVKGKCDWLNIDSLINCRIIQFEFHKTSNRTAKCWKRFFDNWKNGLSLSCYGESEYEVMIGGLIDGGTETEIECLLSEVKRRDGSEFMVKGYTGFHVMPKQAYLEYLKEEDLYHSIQTPPI